MYQYAGERVNIKSNVIILFSHFYTVKFNNKVTKKN